LVMPAPTISFHVVMWALKRLFYSYNSHVQLQSKGKAFAKNRGFQAGGSAHILGRKKQRKAAQDLIR
jgi:hypothetical protein